MAFNFKLPGFGKAKPSSGPVSISPTTVMDTAPIAAKSPASKLKIDFAGTSPLFMLTRFPMAKQLQILGTILLVLIILMAALVVRDNRETAFGTSYVAAAGEMRMLSQRLAKSTAQAIQGKTTAFSQLKDSHEKFALLVDRLTNGGDIENITVPPAPDQVRAPLEELAGLWQKTDKDALAMLEHERSLVTLARDVALINTQNPQLLQLTEQFAALRSGSPQATQMVMLTQRIAKNANALLVGETIDAATAVALGKDATMLRDLVSGFAKGSDALRITAVADADSRQRIGDIEKLLKDELAGISAIVANTQKLTQAKAAGARIIKDSEALLESSERLAHALQSSQTDRTAFFVVLGVLTLIVIGIAALMAKAFFDDQAKIAREADMHRKESEQMNLTNQDAILRLMNELGDLADGDLTVNATVSEDITGAIADSINYTIEELRLLVGRINDAAGRVTQATEIAQQTSAELLAAAEQQSQEIQTAGRAALDMARSMNQVSGHATQSAQVARQSLSAAEKGAVAVQDSIKGMNEIRDQIQETSKRIKRLGESSQEIGEIVELISDITEQTNVLALNAAIQAASAGEAGRGFTVVAEEVQRLAERSAEATKQIGAIVKTIQTDTQDAVSAMEESTQGVVEGAKLSDAAGQALTEIGQVSRNLAQLIENISTATQAQSKSATGVAESMQNILHITEQTTEGTKKTASMVGELASLASELKGSVSGFKVG